jgi:hypothetical protein
VQDSLESLALDLGLPVAAGLLEDEVTRLCGRRYQRRPNRTHTRYRRQRGEATLAGQKVAIEQPRVRQAGGRAEVPLETYARLQSPDAMPRAVLQRMVRGVSTRDYAGVVKLARDGFGVGKSSVSRDFVRTRSIPWHLADPLHRMTARSWYHLSEGLSVRVPVSVGLAGSPGVPHRQDQPGRPPLNRAGTDAF